MGAGRGIAIGLLLPLVLASCDRAPVDAWTAVAERVEIGVTATRVNPLRARYHRALRLRVLGGTRATASLGVTRRENAQVDLYRFARARYRVVADTVSFTVDVDAGSILEVDEVDATDEGDASAPGELLGSFDWDGTGEWRFIPAR